MPEEDGAFGGQRMPSCSPGGSRAPGLGIGRVSAIVSGVARELDLDDLIASWTLLGDDHDMLAPVHPASRLTFAVLLRFFVARGRFPGHNGEVPADAVACLVKQVDTAGHAEGGGSFDVLGRSAQRFRARVRDKLGFRVFTREDENRMVVWLAEHVCPGETGDEQQRAAVAARCRELRLEPPGRLDRVLGAANAMADDAFCKTTVGALPASVVAGLWAALEPSADLRAPDGSEDEDESRTFFGELKQDPGRLGLETLLIALESISHKPLRLVVTIRSLDRLDPVRPTSRVSGIVHASQSHCMQ